MKVSVVIPALNESASIGATIASARAALRGIPHEIVVCDHGSTDNTPAIAEAAGAAVQQVTGGRLGGLRNIGAQATSGKILLFLDADVTLSDAWRSRFDQVLAELESGAEIVTGSNCVPPTSGSWIERNWFAWHAVDATTVHLGTAHLIVPRGLFEKIGGFNPLLHTGEDWDFCVRATRAGAMLRPDPALVAVHHDYPKTIRAFFRREAWHGSGTFKNLKPFIKSKAVWGTFIFIALIGLMLLGIAGLLAGLPFGGGVAAGALIAAGGLCAASSRAKFSRAPQRTVWINTGLFAIYYAARSTALLRTLAAWSRQLVTLLSRRKIALMHDKHNKASLESTSEDYDRSQPPTRTAA